MMSVLHRFRRLSLDLKLIASYLVILGIGGLAISVVGSWIVSTTIRREAQRTVTHDLAVARAAYDQRLELIRRTVETGAGGITLPTHLASGDSAALLGYLRQLRRDGGLDLVALTDARGDVFVRASAVGGGSAAGLAVIDTALRGRSATATELLPVAVVAAEDPAVARRVALPIDARSPAPPVAMVMTAAAPVRAADGSLLGVLWGGVVLNGEASLVQAVWQRLYATEEGQGTVGVFQGDLRIAGAGDAAVGQRASADVAAAVLGRGTSWPGAPFVHDNGYISAFEPIRDARGAAIGMLHVGLREDLYAATRNRVISSFFAIATVGFGLVIAITYRIIHALTRPIREMVAATRRVAAGRFDHPVQVTSGGEIGLLGESINRMQGSLQQMRSELEEAARTLEDKVRSRSEELGRMQARMAQSERLASIGVLAAGVAHEVNNPLGGILALTSLTLEDLPPDDPSRENLEEVVRQTRRCGEIVRHLLEFSRQHQASPEPADLNDLLEKTLALLERQSIFHNVRVERELTPGLPPVVADSSQLQQVFVNILMNAVQAMKERGTLTIASRHAAARDEVVLTFHDTGCGIPADQIDHVFDPFFTTKGSGEGTGLGLSIAYGIVSRHKGSIAVESEPGVGTTFTIRLPATATARAEAPAADQLAGVTD